jgi:hypothetical protein
MGRHGIGDSARTIARIWHLTLNRLADTPLAGQLLRILAWYAPDTIPTALLNGLADPPALTHAIGRLASVQMRDLGAVMDAAPLVEGDEADHANARGLDQATLPTGLRAGIGLPGPIDVRLDSTNTQARLNTRLRGAREFLAPTPT